MEELIDVLFWLNQDILSKVIAFSDQGPRTICILSASGAVSTVTLRQASNPSGSVTYEVSKNLFFRCV